MGITKRSPRILMNKMQSGTPMIAGPALAALKQHQDAIRHYHQSYMKSNDPKEKAVFASKRDDLLNKITQESFREATYRFRSLMS